MYHYIIDSGDSIKLQSTTDILAVPDSAEIIDENEVADYFPLTHSNTNHDTLITHVIALGKFTGKYLVPASKFSNELLKYEQAKDRLVSELDYKIQTSIDNTLCYTTSQLDSIFSISAALVELRRKYNYVAADKITGDRYNQRRNELVIDELLGRPKNHIYDVIKSALQNIRLNTTIKIKKTAEEIMQDIERKYQSVISSPHDEQFINIDLDVGEMSMVRCAITFNRPTKGYTDIEFDPAVESITVVFVEDVNRTVEYYKTNLVSKIAKQKISLIQETVNEMAKGIVCPNTDFKFGEFAIVRPKDKTKSTRAGFLKAINQLKLYSTLKATRQALVNITKEYNNCESLASLVYRQSGAYRISYHANQIRNVIDEKYQITEQINTQLKEMLSTNYSKSAIRKSLFAAIRKELYYVKPTTKKKKK